MDRDAQQRECRADLDAIEKRHAKAFRAAIERYRKAKRRKGGKARAKKLSKKRRREIAERAARTGWRKRKKKLDLRRQAQA